MTEDDLKIYRKIAVWRLRAVYFLIPMLATIPVMFIAYWLCGLFEVGEDDIVAILGLFIFLDLILFIPYAVCVNRQIALTGYDPPFILSCLACIITWPLYILLSLLVLEHSKTMLRQAEYTGDDFFHSDPDPFSGSSSEFSNWNTKETPPIM